MSAGVTGQRKVFPLARAGALTTPHTPKLSLPVVASGPLPSRDSHVDVVQLLDITWYIM